ncbi:hypothetical protein MNB_SV-14-999 [hydrothermal vent metagenome]|uniref:Uncharacterized protein n=1 Tax=hydrothermal vent metagenome TaxID=652676 RepID=A0A1W1CVG2_9ZZZZ
MEKLKDIKDIVEVHEYSFFIFIGLTVFIIILLSLAIYFFKNRRRRRKKPTAKQIALEKLKILDYSNTKSTVYGFEQNSLFFINEENKDEFESLKKELEIYKYKKNIPPLDSKIEKRIKEFIGKLK